ncbi:redoxin domain-containing protein [Mucilaginibacter myungsuensis]|uniref:Redoxin domain-containing protein n=1 Tax=Mucilaginibacter myungsuensis TaxID=649104 RepID=A0A929KVZ7_9SPHI|nr:redoxin domain-containing protein [Mucilaginibacter myungsuensis]MBE9662621.1 redoxin domain-containing protein [Mucilaginibacter myungsuensis]MDN3598041.1 redoxin domain-containing protein [Mucilaginibacter myungsuensis]
MLATALNTAKYPFFDLLEVVPDVDLSFRKYKPLRPVRTGNSLPGFNLRSGYNNWQHFFNGAEIHGPIQIRQLLNKPLVISFYSPQWQQHGVDQLKQLNALQTEIKANGGNLLIVTPEKEAALEKLAWDNSLSLNFYFDADHELAQSLRIYSDADPIWNRFSGIDENVPLAATYVLDTNKQVVYDEPGLDLERSIDGKDIVAAVYQAGLSNSLKRSA